MIDGDYAGEIWGETHRDLTLDFFFYVCRNIIRKRL
jgi:hypothetical protein